MEDPFEIKANLGDTEYTFQVYPGEDSKFAIGLDGVDIGVLKKKFEIDSWEWIEGGNGNPNDLGNKIDSHYL